jgi:cysteine-rich repeat protein
VVVDFASYPAGTEILLQNSAGAPFPNGPVDETKVMKFRVQSQTGDTDPLPASLRAIERLDPATSVMTRDFRLKQSGTDGCGRATWEINNLRWHDITEYPELDTTEIWRFVNDSGVSHPMHMHLVMFQVLDRDTFTKDPNGAIIPGGDPQPPPPEEDGWKDTVMVAPNEMVRVIAHFENYKGLFAYHCHILEHEEHEMMRQFHTVKCGDHEVDAPAETCDDGGTDPYDGCSGRCRIEEFVTLAGPADGGGSVQIGVAGETVTVPTMPGQTAADLAAALAAAINADPELAAMGVVATALGEEVMVEGGDITSFAASDAGVSAPLTLHVQPQGLWWSSGTGTSCDVVRGSLDQALAAGWNFAGPGVTLGCLADNMTTTHEALAGDPAPGQGFWYLVRSQPGGTYDTGSPSQTGSRDSGIAGSGNGCP